MIKSEDLTLAALANFPEQENWKDKRVHQSQIFFGNGFRNGQYFRNDEKKFICHKCGEEGHI